MTFCPQEEPLTCPKRTRLRVVVGLWVDDFTDWGSMYVLNSHTGTSQAHPARCLLGASRKTENTRRRGV